MFYILVLCMYNIKNGKSIVFRFSSNKRLFYSPILLYVYYISAGEFGIDVHTYTHVWF